MSEIFRMPDVGEGLTEAEIVAWHVAPGDPVTVNQIVVEIETAKAVVELPSPWAGTVESLLAEPGATVEVGEPIIAIETGAGDRPAGTAGGRAGAAAPADDGTDGSEGGATIGEPGADGRIATLVGYGPRPGAATRRPRKGRPTAPGRPHDQRTGTGDRADRGPAFPPADHGAADHGAATAAPTPDRDPRSGGPGLVARGPDRGESLVPLATPPVRKLAKDLGVDLRTLAGSGAGGIITREDVQAAAAPAEVPPARDVPVAFGDGTRRELVRGVRKATAAAMVRSAFTAPHVTEFLAVDVTASMELLAELRGRKEFAEVRLTPLALVAKAVCLAARRTPVVNASWDEPAGEIVYYDHVQLGIATATPRGLVVPKIRDADRLDLRGLAAALGELTATAREGRTAPADLVGGTFTITNVGVFGVDSGTPILNPGEAAILAVGSIRQAPWVVDGELAVRQVCQLALSFDHRLVDGEQGSRFLADVGALLHDPATAILW